MSEKGKARRGAETDAGKKGSPPSAARVERKRKGKGDAAKSVPKVAKRETGRTKGSGGGLH